MAVGATVRAAVVAVGPLCPVSPRQLTASPPPSHGRAAPAPGPGFHCSLNLTSHCMPGTASTWPTAQLELAGPALGASGSFMPGWSECCATSTSPTALGAEPVSHWWGWAAWSGTERRAERGPKVELGLGQCHIPQSWQEQAGALPSQAWLQLPKLQLGTQAHLHSPEPGKALPSRYRLGGVCSHCLASALC